MKKIAILASVAVVAVRMVLAATEAPSRLASASAYLLPVERSEGRSLRYWADHPLDAVDTNAEHAAKVSEEQIMANLSSRWCLCFCGTKDVLPKWLDVKPEANAQGPNRYERFKNFRDYISTFPQLNGHFRFVTLEGKPHGGVCYENEPFFDLVFGKR